MRVSHPARVGRFSGRVPIELSEERGAPEHGAALAEGDFMQTPNDVIVHSLTGSKDLLLRFVGDMTPRELVHRPTPESNCAAWLIGHLTLIDRLVLKEVVGDGSLPELPDGFEHRFSQKAGCPQAAEFGDATTLPAIFAAHRDLVIERAKATPLAEMDRPLSFQHPLFQTVGQILNFGGIHTSMHAGQISTIRRSLGKPPLF